jgi:DNA-binding transcriptional LysR family regulator
LYIINPHHLVIFQAIAETGSVSRGAELLFISQPAASAQLRELERQFGTPLFNRLPRGVELTQAGELLFEYTSRCQQELQQTLRSIQDLNGMQRGSLAVGASLTTGSYYLPVVCAAFTMEYPAISLNLSIANTEAICAGVIAGKFDIGFTEGEIPSDALHHEAIYTENLCVIASAHHLLTKNRECSITELTQQKWIVREDGSGTRAVVDAAMDASGVAVNVALTLGSTEAIKRAVAASDLLAVVSRAAATPELELGLLTALPCPCLEISRQFWLVRSHVRKPGHAAREFAAAVHAAWSIL